MSADVSDCIAMAEDGYTWFAFPKTMKRGQVMAALARSAEDIGYGDWQWFLTHYRITAGHVHEEVGNPGYWHEVTDGVVCHLCVPCWIVRQSGGTTCA